ncbi:hypothetical protein EPN44_03580 [bacterium]|nr:MAG: hypothetical protein EPN44_03580 [bacterium]
MMRRIAVALLLCVSGASGAAWGAAAPVPVAAPSPSPAPKDVLPVNSSLVLELDDEISTATTSEGRTFRAHLASALMLSGVKVAAAGTPVIGTVTFVRHAAAPDKDGYMSVRFSSLPLAGGITLPLRPLSATWSIHVTGGQESTSAVTDDIKDIFVPYHFLYRQFRKGSDLDLKPGSTVHALTMGTVRLIAGAPRVELLDPVRLGTSVPYTVVTPIPLFTPEPLITATPKPSPSPTPGATPGS